MSRAAIGGQVAHQDEARRTAANIAKLPMLLNPPTALMPYFLTPLS